MGIRSKEQQDFHRSQIKKLMVIRHDMSLREMQTTLDKNNLHLDLDYINRIRNKISSERARRADRFTLNSALASFQDLMSEVVATGWSIALDPSASKLARVAALETIRKSGNDAFDKMFDAGVFDRKLGTFGVEFRNKPLPPEVLKEIIDTFRRNGKIPLQQHDGGNIIASVERPGITEGTA